MLMEVKIVTEEPGQIEQVLRLLAGAGAITSSAPLERAVQTVAAAETVVREAVEASQAPQAPQAQTAADPAARVQEIVDTLAEIVKAGGRPSKADMESRRYMAQEAVSLAGGGGVLLAEDGPRDSWNSNRCLIIALRARTKMSGGASAMEPEVLPAVESPAPAMEPEVLPAVESPAPAMDLEAPAREVSESEIRAVLNKLAGATDVATVKRLLKEVGGAEDGMLKSVDKSAYGHVMDAAEELLTEKAA